MGMQQILLIVLSVIIVGAAIAVGITMFQTQAVNANRQAVLMDLNTFGASAIAYYKTPTDMGGGGGDFSHGTAPPDEVGYYLANNFIADSDSIHNDNGGYKITHTATVLTIVGKGTEKGRVSANPVGGTMTITPANSDDPLVLTLTN